jgi:hypothetical protein
MSAKALKHAPHALLCRMKHEAAAEASHSPAGHLDSSRSWHEQQGSAHRCRPACAAPPRRRAPGPGTPARSPCTPRAHPTDGR